MRKVMVTMTEELLNDVDIYAKKLNVPRSKFIRLTLKERLDYIKKQSFETLLAEGYQVKAEEDRKDAEAYLGTFNDLKEE